MCRDWQADTGIIADRSDAFQCDVSSPLDSPFIVLFEQYGADEPGDGSFVEEGIAMIAREPRVANGCQLIR